MSNQPREDPLYLNARREAGVILAIWSACLIYTVGFCYLFGYLSHEPDPGSTGLSIGEWVGPLTSLDREAASLEVPLGLGMPDWVFYGVGVPWLLCIVVTWWFCTFYFTEDELGADFKPEGSQ